MSAQLAAKFWRVLLFAAMAAAIGFACLPAMPAILNGVSDTALHASSFFILAILARPAYPQARSWSILVALSAMGGLIEVVQAFPQIDRDASLIDLLVDVLAVAVALVFMNLLGLRPASGTKNTSA